MNVYFFNEGKPQISLIKLMKQAVECCQAIELK